MATVTALGHAFTTVADNKTVTATPALNDLIVIVAATSGLAGGTINITDNNSGGAGTYTQVDADRTGFSTTGVLTVWVRNSLIGSASSTIFTATQTGSSGGGLSVLGISGMSIVGLGAIRGSGGQSTGTAATTPAPVLLGRVGTVFSGTQAALTGNVVIGAVGNATNPAALTPRSSPAYSEASDLGYGSPTTGLELMFINSGETASTITWGGTSASTFASLAIEVDASVPQYDWVQPGNADKDSSSIRGAVSRAGVW
jgi:hypothetical protein